MNKNKKYIEYSIFNTHNQFEIQDFIFRAIKKGVGGIVLPNSYLAEYTSLIPHGINISTVIDYPSGLETTGVRQHAIASAANKGAKSVDLVAQHLYLLNNKTQKFIDDISACINIAEEKGCTLRLMLDYRLVGQTSEIDAICKMIQHLNIEYVLPSTGFFVDEFSENLIISKYIEKTYNIATITNGNIYSKEHYQTALKSEVFGIRINNITALERLL